MDRKAYNSCMKPYLTGQKTKDQRKLDFCIGAKVCSGKADNQTEAKGMCADSIKEKAQAATSQENAVPVDAVPAEAVSTPAGSSCPGKTMADWIQEEDPKNCRPCLLGPIAQWYRDELLEQKHEALAQSLIEKAANEDPLTLCQELDRIKAVVGESTRERLKDFDCAAQTFNPDDAPAN